MKKGKSRIGKTFTQCKKRSAEGKERSDPSKNRRQSAPKRARSLEKSPEVGLKTGKSGKNGDLGAKKVGWGSGEKMGFTADFAML